MNQLQSGMRSLRNWFTKLTRWQQYALLACGLGLFGTMLWVGLTPHDDPLTPVLDGCEFAPGEISAVQLAFAQEGLDEYEIRSSTIWVPTSQRSRYLKSIAKHDAVDLRNQPVEASHPFNLFLTSQQQEEMRIRRDKERLQQHIEQLDPIATAAIEYSQMRRNGPFRPMVRRATINVKTVDDQFLTRSCIGIITAQVKATFPAVEDADIQIIDVVNQITYRADQQTFDPATIAQMRLAEVDRGLRRALVQMLPEFIDLGGQVTVQEVDRGVESYAFRSQLASQSLPAPASRASSLPASATRVSQGAGLMRGANGTAALPTSYSPPLPASPSASGSGSNRGDTPARRYQAVFEVAESAIRDLIGRESGVAASTIDAGQVDQRFQQLQRVWLVKLEPVLQANRVAEYEFVISPDSKSPAVREPDNIAVEGIRTLFEQHWKFVVLVVFGICTVFILRPNKSK